MPRPETSRLVRLACEAGDPHAALALLEQSIALGHRRIALIRYLLAERLRAPLEARHHDYVRDVAARMSAKALARVAGEARARAQRTRLAVVDANAAAPDNQAGCNPRSS